MTDGKVEFRELRDGMKVKCVFENDMVADDACITVEEMSIYICQNVRRGESCKDKKGYECSWYIGRTDFSGTVSNDWKVNEISRFEIVDDCVKDDSDPANWHEGEILTDGLWYRMVLFNNGFMLMMTLPVLQFGQVKDASSCISPVSIPEARRHYEEWHIYHEPPKPTEEEQEAALEVLTRAGRIVDGKVVQQ